MAKKPIDRGKPIKKPNRPITLPIRKAAKGAAEEGKQERLQASAFRKIKRESRSLGRTPKAKNLTSLMRKGYRKGYRVKSTRGGSRR